MSNWYKKINNQTDYILQKIKEHPFINELMDGTLDKDIFLFYIAQDALYLSEYIKISEIVINRRSHVVEIMYDSIITKIVHFIKFG